MSHNKRARALWTAVSIGICFSVAAVIASFHGVRPEVYTAQLRVEVQPAAGPNKDAHALLYLNSDVETVSGVQADLRFDPNLLQIHCTGTAELAQGKKVLLTASPEPGRIRALVIGMNEAPMPNGPFAHVRLSTKYPSTAEAPVLRLEKVVATSPDGQAVPTVAVQ